MECDEEDRSISEVRFDLDDLLTGKESIKRLVPKQIRGVEVTNIVLNIYRGDEWISSLSGGHAQILPRGGGIVIEDDVLLASSNGNTLKCKEINWSSRTDKLSALGAYELKVDNRTVSGRGLLTDYRLEHVEFAGRKG